MALTATTAPLASPYCLDDVLLAVLPSCSPLIQGSKPQTELGLGLLSPSLTEEESNCVRALRTMLMFGASAVHL